MKNDLQCAALDNIKKYHDYFILLDEITTLPTTIFTMKYVNTILLFQVRHQMVLNIHDVTTDSSFFRFCRALCPKIYI